MTNTTIRSGKRYLLWILALCVAATCCQDATAQRRKKKKGELEIPKMETVKLTTSDKVTLRCSYYPGGFYRTMVDKEVVIKKKAGKQTVPIILVHDWEGSRADYDLLATGLQGMGHAVIVPDLRGHGDSLTREKNGAVEEIELARMRKQDIQGIGFDIEAAKKYLIEKNNAGELNIELLCVVGSGFGGTMALNWAYYDWERKQLPAFKQGKDVKGLVLLSPKQSHKGVALNKEVFNQPDIAKKVSFLILVGARDTKAVRDAKTVNNRIKRHRLKEEDKEGPEKSLFYITLDTELQSTELLKARGLPQNPYNYIGTFVTWRHTQQVEDNPWQNRPDPLAAGQ